MITVDTLTAYLYNGMAFLRCLSEQAIPLGEILKPDDADNLGHLVEVYFGDTAFTGYQRRAIAAATAQQHSIDDLQRIERHTRGLTRNAAWRLRAHLCGIAGEAIDSEARAQLRSLRPAPAQPKLGVHIRRGTGGAPDTLIYRGTSKDVTWLYEHLDRPISALGAGYNLGDSRNTTPEATAHIVITLEDVVGLTYEDNDVILTMTNGARITGAEWAAMRLHEVGFVTLLHPVEGPVNLYRTERFPNMKQRLMAAAESPLCRWPGCRQSASRSQIHHLRAWKNGGETNAKNLTVLCDYHNGVNNDDPGTVTTGRGHLERHTGGVTWVHS